MPLHIVRNDIANMDCDAIVNTANPYPQIGAGTDSAIYEAAGKEKLLAARRKIGEIAPGQAAVTKGYALKARYIIHTVGPVWEGGEKGEEKLLRSCYRTSLRIAQGKNCRTVAFPLISAGSYGYPKEEALSVAVEEIRDFLEESNITVYLVVFGREAYELSGRYDDAIESFIDEHYVERQSEVEYGSHTTGFLGGAARREWDDRRKAYQNMYMEMPSANMSDASEASPFSADESVDETQASYADELDAETQESCADEFVAELPDSYADELDAEIQAEAAADMSGAGAAEAEEVEAWAAEEDVWHADGFYVDSAPEAVEPPRYEKASSAPSAAKPWSASKADKAPSAPPAWQVSKSDTAPTPPPAWQDYPGQMSAPAAAPRGSKPSFSLPSLIHRKKRTLDESDLILAESFSETLLRLIDERDMTDVEVYKRANIDRKLFSKIRSRRDYQPGKKTAFALAIALQLDLDQTKDLLARAGYAISPSSKFDLIVEFFIVNEVYDIDEINMALFNHHEQTLG